MKNIKTIKLFGVNFIDENFNIIKKLLKRGGLLVLPSGPGLSDIKKNVKYHKALKNADIALFDSGYLCLLLKLKNIHVKKFSGFLFFKKLIHSLTKEPSKKILLIDPNKNESKINYEFLKSKKILKVYNYISPWYNTKNIKDSKLLIKIKKIKPNYIIINLGGGTQERLGSYIKNNINFKPAIICSGAAISFFTKQQAPINIFFDKIYLGWLIRIIFKPSIFLPRYLSAFKLIFLINDL
tara:strand:+ start:185 stop:901 length:717 start_codon:yes stop_codon:yes gene_type:complete